MRQRRADIWRGPGTALSVLLWPLQKLMEGVGWLLEKLDLIPDGIERARLEAARLRAIPVMWEWDEKSGRMVKREWQWSSEKPASKGSAPPPNVLGGNSGTERRLGQIADNTKGLLDEEKRKRIGPGDIVFKNLPQPLQCVVNGRNRGLSASLSALARLLPLANH